MEYAGGSLPVSPAVRPGDVRARLPEPLAPLQDLAMNLRWSWDERTRDLFRWVDPEAQELAIEYRLGDAESLPFEHGEHRDLRWTVLHDLRGLVQRGVRRDRSGRSRHGISHGDSADVVVHLAALGEHPDAGDPEQQQRTGQPDDLRVRIEVGRALVVDVEGQHHHGKITGCRAQRGDHAEVRRVVAAAARFLGVPASAGRVELRIPLHQREAQEDEHRKGEDPERQRQLERRGAGDLGEALDDDHSAMALPARARDSGARQDLQLLLDRPTSLALVPTTEALRDRLVEACRIARDQFDYQQLMEIAGVDYPDRAERFEVNYHFLSLTNNHRFRIKVTTDEETPVPSLTGLWPVAGWLEREVFDMYGVTFAGNADLRRILTDYGFEGYPLRKDFPQTGYVELRYSETEKRVVYEPVELPQDFRHFDFLMPWEGPEYRLPGDEKAMPQAPGAPSPAPPPAASPVKEDPMRRPLVTVPADAVAR